MVIIDCFFFFADVRFFQSDKIDGESHWSKNDIQRSPTNRNRTSAKKPSAHIFSLSLSLAVTFSLAHIRFDAFIWLVVCERERERERVREKWGPERYIQDTNCLVDSEREKRREEREQSRGNRKNQSRDAHILLKESCYTCSFSVSFALVFVVVLLIDRKNAVVIYATGRRV